MSPTLHDPEVRRRLRARLAYPMPARHRRRLSPSCTTLLIWAAWLLWIAGLAAHLLNYHYTR